MDFVDDFNFSRDILSEEKRGLRWWEPLLYVGLVLFMLASQIIITGTRL